jgi:RES domain-containing protein
MNIITEKKITSQEIARALKMSHDDVVAGLDHLIVELGEIRKRTGCATPTLNCDFTTYTKKGETKKMYFLNRDYMLIYVSRFGNLDALVELLDMFNDD